MAEGSSRHSVPFLDATVTAMGTTTYESTMLMPPFITDNTGTSSQGFFCTKPVSMRQQITISSSSSSSYVAGLSTFSHSLYVAASLPIRCTHTVLSPHPLASIAPER